MDALRDAYADEDIELSDYKLKILITFLKNKRMIEQVDKGKKKAIRTATFRIFTIEKVSWMKRAYIYTTLHPTKI